MLDTLQGLVSHAGTGSRIVSLPIGPAEALTRLASRAGLSPLGPYHALMYGRPLWFDIRKARRELGFEPRFSSVEALCQSYDWYLAHRAEILSRQHGSLHSMAVKQGMLSLVPNVLSWLPASGART